MKTRIEIPSGAGAMDEVRAIFREYAAWLGVDLCFQGFERELAELPGCYAPPGGRILLARDGAAVAGCVALRLMVGGGSKAGKSSFGSSESHEKSPAGGGGATGSSTAEGGCATDLSVRACEMKRLYVRPAWRGTGLGRLLAERIVATGRELGYAVMRLDTLAQMTAAVRLYESLGFREVEAYYHNPLAGVRFMELKL